MNYTIISSILSRCNAASVQVTVMTFLFYGWSVSKNGFAYSGNVPSDANYNLSRQNLNRSVLIYGMSTRNLGNASRKYDRTVSVSGMSVSIYGMTDQNKGRTKRNFGE